MESTMESAGMSRAPAEMRDQAPSNDRSSLDDEGRHRVAGRSAETFLQRHCGLTVAVIVPAYNAARDIHSCLAALLEAGCSAAEVVVVDDCSSDDTVSLARSFGVRVVRRQARGGPAAARNSGVDATTAEALVFVDADVIVADDTLTLLLDHISDDAPHVAVIGSYDDAPVAMSMVSRYRNLLHHFVHQQAAREASTFWTGYGAVLRDAFVAVGGFDERAELNYVEDIEFGMRLRRAGYRIRLEPMAQCKHAKAWTLATMLRTDLYHRAIPWSRLLLSRQDGWPDDLNVSRRQRLSAATAALGPIALLGMFIGVPFAAPAWLVFSGLFLFLNLGLFRFFARSGGLWFAGACIPLHAAHQICAALGFAVALLGSRGANVASGSQSKPWASLPQTGNARAR